VSEPQPLIGPATIDDVAELARLRWELYAEQNGEPSEPFKTYETRFARFARSALTSEDWRAWVARTDDGLVGATWLHTVHRVPVPGKRAGPIGYLTNVYIAPEHRNAGLGAQILDRVKAWCGEEGFSLVIVWPTERSRSFYRRGGFDRLDEPLVLDGEPDTPFEHLTGGET
jgi:GNAT superfamily N-acetyltransferase